MSEIWRTIAGYEGLYEVSNKGRVRSKTLRLRSPSYTKDGYHKLNLSNKGKCTTHQVHRLVALAFLPNPLGLPHVNHKDEDKENNDVSNLEWCTAQYNSVYSHGVSGRLLSPAGVVVSFTNIAGFCKEHGLHENAVNKLLSGVFNQTKGWTRIGDRDE